jgi:predicted phosphodiesterase
MRRYDDIPRIVSGPGSEQRPLRRLGVIGDVHAEDERLALAIETLTAEGAERLVCVGDVADGMGDLDRAVHLLDSAGVKTIAGNHERWFLGDTMRDLRNVQHRDAHPEAARALAFYPPLLELQTVKGTMLLCHAVGKDDMTVLDDRTSLPMARWMPEFVAIEAAGRFRFVVAGHVHRFFVRRFPGFVWINAGTLKRDDDPCFVLIDLEAGTAGEVHQFMIEDDLTLLRRSVALDALVSD